jgi:hypothetical protein
MGTVKEVIRQMHIEARQAKNQNNLPPPKAPRRGGGRRRR